MRYSLSEWRKYSSNQDFKLYEFIHLFNWEVSKKEKNERYGVFEAVENHVKKWSEEITQYAAERCLIEADESFPFNSENYEKAKLFLCGSELILANLPGGDMDLVILAPSWYTEEDFDKKMLSMLRKDENVTDIYLVTRAKVPLIRFSYGSVKLDLTFVRSTETGDMIRKNQRNQEIGFEHLLHVRKSSVLSLMAIFSRKLMRMVPNMNTFLFALRAIKVWAKCQGINSQLYGYLGGISLAVMVAKICQNNEIAKPAELVYRFFEVFSRWNWEHPVVLEEYDYLTGTSGLPEKELRVSNAKDRYLESFKWDKGRDEKNLNMPILSFTYPQLNTARNISKWAMEVLLAELREGFRICQMIGQRKAAWGDLLTQVNFFRRFEHFLCVRLYLTKEPTDAECLLSANPFHFLEQDDESDYDSELEKYEEPVECVPFGEYVDFVESSLYWLMDQIQKKTDLERIRINPRKYTPKTGGKHSKMWFIGFETRNIDEVQCVQKLEEEFKKKLECYEHVYRNNRERDEKNRKKAPNDQKVELFYTNYENLKNLLDVGDIDEGQLHKKRIDPYSRGWTNNNNNRLPTQ